MRYSGTVSLPAGFTVPSGETWDFDPDLATTVTVSANVVVYGTLSMRPANPSVVHQLIFTGINEAGMVGGGHDPLATDVGLWVLDGGRLDIAGSPVEPWGCTTGALSVGATSLTLDRPPTGWKVGDSIIVCPTEAPTVVQHWTHFEERTIAAVSGNTVSWAQGLTWPHPAVTVKPGMVRTAEVLNLTRNVRIEGTATGRTHILINGHDPALQMVSHTALRHMGPRRSATEFILGRYGLHIHHCHEGSAGSVIEGVVARDIGSHVFVPHLSNGITFSRCVTYNTTEEPFWWDPPLNDIPGDPTDDCHWDDCVAAKVLQGQKVYRLAAFVLGVGARNTCDRSIAVGVQGGVDSCGFTWPENSDGEWSFVDSVAHNNKLHGIFVWQNNANPHDIDRYIGFHNGDSGIAHGAYINRYHFRDCVLYGNLKLAIRQWAVSRHESPLLFANCWCDGGGVSAHVVEFFKHSVDPQLATRYEACTFRGFTTSAIHLVANPSHLADLVDCTWVGAEFKFENTIAADSLVRVQDSVHGPLALRRADQAQGTLNTTWNAKVETIPAFEP